MQATLSFIVLAFIYVYTISKIVSLYRDVHVFRLLFVIFSIWPTAVRITCVREMCTSVAWLPDSR